jgi:hypothetical protein
VNDIESVGRHRINNHSKIKIAATDLIEKFSRWRNNQTQIHIGMLRAKRRHRVVQMVDRSSIDHANAHSPDASGARQGNPSTQIPSVGNHPLRVGQDVGHLISKHLPSTLSLE